MGWGERRGIYKYIHTIYIIDREDMDDESIETVIMTILIGLLIASVFLLLKSSTTTALLTTSTVAGSSSSYSKSSTAAAAAPIYVTNINSGGETDEIDSGDGGKVVGLFRYAVKGLTGDNLEQFHDGSVQLDVGEAFPDDRRYAFLKRKKNENKSKSKNNDMSNDMKTNIDDIDDGPQFDPTNPVWLHKQNFLCAFSDPEFMAQFLSKYDHTTTLLDLYRRTYTFNTKDDDEDDDGERNDHNNDKQLLVPLLKSVDLSSESDRQRLADFFTKELKKERMKNSKEKGDEENDDDFDKLICVTAVSPVLSSSSLSTLNKDSDVHSHQFGNTSSGWKRNKDTRTVHIINAATVRQISDVVGIPINPLRFRPNIIVDGLPPWEEFDRWVGPSSKTQKPTTPHVIQCGGVNLSIISRTVRCQVSV